jgi:IS5 family transposase
MLGKQDGEKDFFDSYVEQRLLPKEHELLKIDEQVDFSFVEEEVEDLYCAGNGRPSYPPEQMFRILFLEYYYNLSDVEVVKQLQVNILFRRFVRLSLEDSVPDDSSLSVFRSRLGEERFQGLFEGLVCQCQEKGLLGNRLKLIDATHIIADVAVPNMIKLLRDGRRGVLKRIEERHGSVPELQAFCPEGGAPRRYGETQLVEEVEQTRRLMAQVKGKYEGAEEEVALLEEAITPTGRRTVVSLVDPDARLGHKAQRWVFAGYKAHLSEDSSSELVTSVDVVPGNVHEADRSHVERLLERDRRQGIHHRGMAADALYDDGENYALAKRHKMTAYIRGRTKKRRAADFYYDYANDQLICGQGERTIGKSRQKKGELYYFETNVCRRCEQEVCHRDAKGRVRVYLSAGEKMRRMIPKEAMRQAMEERKKVERKFGQAKRHHRLSRARYRGRWRVAIQVLMTFFVINAKRMVKLLAERPKPPSLAPG